MRIFLTGILVFGLGCASAPVFKTWSGDDSPVNRKIQEIIAQGKQIRIGVLGLTTSRLGDNSSQKGEWTRRTERKVTEVLEHHLRKLFLKEKNFKLVTREDIERSLGEVRESLEAYATAEDRRSLAAGLGLSHLVWFTYSRSSFAKGELEDIAKVQLLDLRSGEVLAEQLARRINR